MRDLSYKRGQVILQAHQIALKMLLRPTADPLVEGPEQHCSKGSSHGARNLPNPRSEILLSKQLDQRLAAREGRNQSRGEDRIADGAADHRFRVVKPVAKQRDQEAEGDQDDAELE